MARKKQFDYFDALVSLAENGRKAAVLLLEIIENYNYDTLASKAEHIHQLEREGDQIAKSIMAELNDSFITPIDREDIVQLTERLDDVLDDVNGISYLFDNLLITELRPQVTRMVQYIVEACDGVYVVAKEFSKFKNSKTLGKMIEHVNELEAEGDKLYSSAIKDLFGNVTDAIEIIKWKEIFAALEETINDSETAVDVLAGTVIKNT